MTLRTGKAMPLLIMAVPHSPYFMCICPAYICTRLAWRGTLYWAPFASCSSQRQYFNCSFCWTISSVSLFPFLFQAQEPQARGSSSHERFRQIPQSSLFSSPPEWDRER